MLNICVSGAAGWTRRESVRGVLKAEDMTLASAVARQAVGQDVGAALGGPPVGVTVAASLEKAFAAPCDMLIDDTQPAAGKAHALAAIGRGISVVLRHRGVLTAKPLVFGSRSADRRLGAITGAVGGWDKPLFGEA